MIGGVAGGSRVVTQAGGDLIIKSPQNTDVHDERHESQGLSALVPLLGNKFNVSAYDSRHQLSGDYQSVGQQSGIQAGDGGYEVTAGGQTQLTGSAITSTQAAIDAGLNRFTTAGKTAVDALASGDLAVTDLNNAAHYDAESLSVSASLSQAGPRGGVGLGEDSGRASSTTASAISGLAGNQDARTGDAETGLAPIFDADNVRNDVQAQAEITQAFGSQASKEWGGLCQ